MREHFEPTQKTWIGERLRGGESGLRDVRRHVAETYSLPLQVYYRSTSWFRESANNPDWVPENVVHDFLADRLGRDNFLHQWLDSGLRLRKWLINGLHFFLHEYFRAVQPVGHGEAGVSRLGIEQEPGGEADRLMVYGLVHQAIRGIAQAFNDAGQAQHAEVFVAFYFQQQPVATIAETMRLTPGQVKGMLRLGRIRFKARFLELLEHDGVTATQRDEEIQTILQIIDS